MGGTNCPQSTTTATHSATHCSSSLDVLGGQWASQSINRGQICYSIPTAPQVTPSHPSQSTMNSTKPQVIFGSWTPSSPSTAPTFPAPVHWTMSQLDNLPPPPPYPSKEGYFNNLDNSEETILIEDVESFAKNMFWWGFCEYPSLPSSITITILILIAVLPLLWIAGVFLIFSKLRAPSSWDLEKSPEESVRLLRLIREAELRWAWRCAYALSTLSLIAFLLFLIIKFSILSG
jgi:hypothetical protein